MMIKRNSRFISGFFAAVVAVVAVGFVSFVHAQTANTTFLPSAPSGVAATIIPPNQVSISWGASTETSGTIEGYNVYRNGVPFTTTAGTSLVDAGLLPGIYNYTVKAYDSNGNVSALSSPASVTLIIDTTPPSTPTGITITGTTSTNSSYASTTLTISWNASTDPIGVAGYQVYRSGGPQAIVTGPQLVSVSTSSALTSTSFTDTVLPGTYTYAVSAYDAAQNVSNRSMPATVTVGVVTTPPSVPTEISAEQVSATGVNLSWAASTGPIGVAGYQVYRDGVQIASTTGPSYSDTGISTTGQYAYAVAAYDAVGNVSGRSAPANVTVQLVSGPLAPYILSATLVGTSTAQISWSFAEDALAITGYAVYRNGAQVASVTSTSYLDSGLAPGIYSYDVSATDVSGAVSATSSPLSVTVPVAALAPVSVPVVVGPTIAPPSPTVPVNVASGTASAPTGTGNPVFTQFLYFGLRAAQVESLQSLLVADGYLAPADATGFFGNLTQGALQKFQCDQNIVCTGGPGWGTVGPKTRNVLNRLQGNGVSSAPLSSSSSSLNAEIQMLQAELANLERQIPSANP